MIVHRKQFFDFVFSYKCYYHGTQSFPFQYPSFTTTSLPRALTKVGNHAAGVCELIQLFHFTIEHSSDRAY